MDKDTLEIPIIDEEELNRPPRRRKKRRKKRYLLRLFVILILIGGILFGLSLPYFDIVSIKVVGNKYVKTEEVLRDSKLKVGENIFKNQGRQIKKRMMDNPYFEEIDIDKKLPNEVVINVKERIPMAVLPYGDRYVVLDGNGIVLGLTDKHPKLTEITGTTIKNMEKGKKVIAKDEKNFDKALDLLEVINKNDLFFKSVRITGTKVECVIYDNLLVKGKYDDLISNIKNGNLSSVLYDLYKKKIKRGTVKIDGEEYCSFTPTF